ncbi:hypothetical protein [Paenibacillus sp. OV219]|uniref:hypothetical protein n=1 Tax=Paenibacillus sp. OV219 TaxID=1884377 RepID=UPI0008BBD81B|nr:hypothetical protein [Paenibacillus sp. OV219]SEP15545.1 hypothetical protein SAMN05518847_12110 [Paenibacillus sp. OV219]
MYGIQLQLRSHKSAEVNSWAEEKRRDFQNAAGFKGLALINDNNLGTHSLLFYSETEDFADFLTNCFNTEKLSFLESSDIIIKKFPIQLV